MTRFDGLSARQVCPLCGGPKPKRNAAKCKPCENDARRARRTPEVDLFWSKVDRRGSEECWPWLGRTNVRYGYGYLDALVGGRLRSVTAHRFSLALKLGREVRAHWRACHTCDNPPCVNPAHLYEGTQAENHRDAVERKGHWPGLKLNPAAVREIRRLAPTVPRTVLAETFHVTTHAIWDVVRGNTWRWVS